MSAHGAEGYGTLSRVPDKGGTTATKLAPFLRWAGGKRWLLFHLEDVLGSFQVNRYHEPFLGGAAMFLGVQPTGWSYLSDLNAELVETYLQVKDDPDGVAELLVGQPNSLDHYYSVREQEPSTPVERAARFIYLNHHSFNGIYRVNLDGRYNVPFGNREWPNPPDAAELRAVSRRLKRTTIRVGDFEALTKGVVREGDLVFLDPPYTVAHNTNGFIKYNQRLFSFEDQRRLRRTMDRIASLGAYYVITNAAHRSIAELFDADHRRIELTRRNNVGGSQAARGSASEYLFTNLPTSG